MPRTALIAGATGLVGAALLRQLAAHAEYAEVRALGRRPPSYGGVIEKTQRTPPLAHGASESGKIRSVATDFGNLAQLGAALAVDDVFCCLGTTLRKAGSRAAFERVDYHMVVDLARATHKAGAQRFLVVSAVGASSRSPAFYSRVKARMEEAVAEVPFTAVHIVRPSLLLGARAENRPGEALAQKLSPLLSLGLVGPLAKYRPVAADDVAAALVRAALADTRGVQVHHLPE